MFYRFSEPMVYVFQSDDRWTILSKKLVMAFESRYALRLFEMLSLRRYFDRQTETFELQDLRSGLGVERDKLKTWNHFRLKCLDPAVNEVQKIMGMNIKYEMLKSGKSISSVVISWSDPMAAAEKPARSPGQKAAVSPAEPAPPATKPAFPGKNTIRYREPWA